MHTISDLCETSKVNPEWIRVKSAVRMFGIGQSRLYELIQAGTVKSVCLRERGKARGIRLISVDSMRSLMERAAAGQCI